MAEQHVTRLYVRDRIDEDDVFAIGRDTVFLQAMVDEADEFIDLRVTVRKASPGGVPNTVYIEGSKCLYETAVYDADTGLLIGYDKGRVNS